MVRKFDDWWRIVPSDLKEKAKLRKGWDGTPIDLEAIKSILDSADSSQREKLATSPDDLLSWISYDKLSFRTENLAKISPHLAGIVLKDEDAINKLLGD